jgi:thiol:disulfide interchange protein DsbG
MKILKSLILAAALLMPLSALAQNSAAPSLPEPIQNLADEGAQVRYLGREHGLDGWITIKNGQEQYFYVLPDKSAFLMGILFNGDGKALTIQQIQKLRGDDAGTLDSLTGTEETAPATVSDAFKFESPSERLYHDIEQSNWIPLGEDGAPIVYSFIDPQCPHCHAFIDQLRDGLLQTGAVQVRIIPVGFKDETKAQAAYLLATPSGAEKFLKHLDGDTTALPAKSDINQQGVQRNLAIMQSWKFDVTPLLIYRAKDGSVKLLRGKPQDINALVSDLGTRS